MGGIDAKYDVAISTTCGALDNIVVQDVDTAQQCIRMLKERNLGIATFIALDKQQHYQRYMATVPQTYAIGADVIELLKEQGRPG